MVRLQQDNTLAKEVVERLGGSGSDTHGITGLDDCVDRGSVGSPTAAVGLVTGPMLAMQDISYRSATTQETSESWRPRPSGKESSR